MKIASYRNWRSIGRPILGFFIAVIVVAAALAAVYMAGKSGGEGGGTPPPSGGNETGGPPGGGGVITLKIGGLFDLSGPTSDVGKPYAYGVLDAVDYFNEKGVTWKGRRVRLELIWHDYGYQVPKAQQYYRELRNAGAVAIIGWGTGDTETLADMVAEDHIVYISASYSAALTVKPYNFFPVPDYSTQLRAALKWVKEHWNESRPPRIVFMYPDVAYGTAPIRAGKTYAQELGFEIGEDQVLELTATEATSQIQYAKEFGADYVWLGGTISSVAVALRDAAKYGFQGKFIINIWGFDERITQLAGDAANGRAIGLAPVAYPGIDKDVPGMAVVLEAAREHGRSDINMRYVQGFVNVWLLVKAIEKADNLTGPGLKTALESMRNEDMGGLVPPVSFYPGDHRPSMRVRLLMVDGQGRLVSLGWVELERRSDWLGW